MYIIFVTVVPFPYGTASSVRCLNLCKILNELGHKVHVISDFPSEVKNSNDPGCCTFESCNVKKELSSIIIARKSLDVLKKHCRIRKPDIIICNARYDRYFQLVGYCNKMKIPLIVENCEWYDPSSFKLGKVDFRYLINQRMITHGFKKASGAISISTLLDNHNRNLGLKSIRIPTILDVLNTKYSCLSNSDKISIMYAGNMGKSKELLNPMFDVLSRNKDIRSKIIFHIYGPSKSDVVRHINNSSVINDLEDVVIMHGKISQIKMPEIMDNADYMFFLRPNRRSSNAGFPTKLGESMATATPVITNKTGDIGMYLGTDYNGFLLESNSADELEKVLSKVVNLSNEKILLMKQNARKTAEKYFDYRCYLSQMNDFLLNYIN